MAPHQSEFDGCENVVGKKGGWRSNREEMNRKKFRPAAEKLSPRPEGQADTDADNGGYPIEGIASKSLLLKDLCRSGDTMQFRNCFSRKDLCHAASRARAGLLCCFCHETL